MDPSPVERVIEGWELTRQWMAEDMAEMRRLRALVRGCVMPTTLELEVLEYLDGRKPYREWVCTYRQGSVMKWEHGTRAYGMAAPDNDPLAMWAFAKKRLDEASACQQP